MSEKPMKNDLSAVEAALGALRPTPSGVDRDRLMYLAGQAAAGRSHGSRRRRADWLWPCATAASILLAVSFATMWLAAEPEVRIVYVPSPAPAREGAGPTVTIPEELIQTASPSKTWRTDYLDLRRLVTTEGVDAMRQPDSAPAAHGETLRWRSGLERTLEELLEG